MVTVAPAIKAILNDATVTAVSIGGDDWQEKQNGPSTKGVIVVNHRSPLNFSLLKIGDRSSSPIKSLNSPASVDLTAASGLIKPAAAVTVECLEKDASIDLQQAYSPQ